MTDIVFTIGTGKDYSTVSACASNEATDLPSDGDTHTYKCDAGTYTDNTAFSGYTADATNYLRITCADGDEHLGQLSGGVIWDQGGGSTGVWRPLSGTRITFDNIHFEDSVFPHDNNGGSIFDCYNIIVTNSGGDGIPPSELQGDVYHIMSINAGDDGMFLNGVDSAWGCASIGAGNRGIYGGALTDCYSVDSSGDDFSNPSSQTKCFASDTTGTNDNATLYDDATKGSASSGDIIVTESALATFDGTLIDHANNGIFESGTNAGKPTNDIAGVARPNPPSVGPFEGGSVVLTREQDSFRIYTDGTESGSVAEEAQNTDATIVPETPFQIRIGMQTVGDAPAEAAKLQYRKVGESVWRDVD